MTEKDLTIKDLELLIQIRELREKLFLIDENENENEILLIKDKIKNLMNEQNIIRKQLLKLLKEGSKVE